MTTLQTEAAAIISLRRSYGLAMPRPYLLVDTRIGATMGGQSIGLVADYDVAATAEAHAARYRSEQHATTEEVGVVCWYDVVS